MSHWNHRVVRSTNTFPSSEVEGEYNFSIREVYYNDAGEITGITENPAAPWGDTIEDLELSLTRMVNACGKEVLIEEDIVYGSWGEDSENSDESDESGDCPTV
jgi:hypothetical protein